MEGREFGWGQKSEKNEKEKKKKKKSEAVAEELWVI